MDAGEEVDDEEYDRIERARSRAYFAPELTNGAIPICHHGCAIRDWLVVSGPEAGNVWTDDRASDGGIFPVTTRGRERTSFLEWYWDWLQAARRTVVGAGPRPE